MIITGEREIRLVTWNEAHFHQLYPMANNPKIAMNLKDSYPQPYTIHDAGHRLEHNQKYNADKTLQYRLKKDDQDMCGMIWEKRIFQQIWSWDFELASLCGEK